MLATMLDQHDADAYAYIGEISRVGYRLLSDACSNKKRKNAILLLVTNGGDPHAGFRIARALTHYYGGFKVIIPMECKSAGTLICIGANELILGDRSELGPLDIQVRKRDELFDRGSGLDILQSLNYMQAQAMNAFRDYLLELTRSAGLGTKIASKIASNLATGLFAPMYSQVDPVKLGEMQRAMEIALAYGQRLADTSKNLKDGALKVLVTGYPSHSFVIDRKEARSLFNKVRQPNDIERELCELLYPLASEKSFGVPQVIFLDPSQFPEGDSHVEQPQDTPPDATRSQGGNTGGEQKVHSPGNGADQQPNANTQAVIG